MSGPGSNPTAPGINSEAVLQAAAALFQACPDKWCDIHDRIEYGRLARSAWTLAEAVLDRGNGLGYRWQGGPWDEGER
jgi:hypothetical protein